MRLRVLAIGRLKNGPEARLIDEYRKRLRWKLVIDELEARAPRPASASMAREADLFRRALADPGIGRTVKVALDENGVSLSSRDFALRISAGRDQGTAEIVYLIGGADGLDPGLLSEADHRLSLGRMTWPHALARVLLVEQVDRAQQIIAGHPSHRD